MKTIVKNIEHLHITLNEIKQHLRISPNYTDEDTQLITLLNVATSEAESFIDNNIAFKELESKIKNFESSEIEIEQGNLKEVVSIMADNIAITDYELDINEFNFNISFSGNITASELVITYKAGTNETSKVHAINQAILIRIADRYEVTRSSYHTAGYNTNTAFESLLMPYRKILMF
ncbi:head-tail connector protein [Rufibacter sp. LB8]|uniref:head-tail connector protein n=1 Tax=Rufibacter sp. LB8 TaxID=2777781 RepID=UPI00178C58E4|nr:head-tail connector protein [Rufibacter sp. LB8]